MAAAARPDEVLAFWFGAAARPRWFKKDPAFDDEIRRRFATTLARATAGGLGAWEAEPESSLALVIVLDQFPRNLHRDTARAFAADAKARAVAAAAIEREFDRRAPPDRRFFFYLPFEHSEDPADQLRSVALFRRLAEEAPGAAADAARERLDYAIRHQRIVERFGRFPHRNRVLGRESTAEETAFLAESGSSF